MEKIIILRSAVLGDFIISSPALNFIREKNPEAKIYLFTIQSAHEKDRNAVKVYENKKSLPWLELLDKNIMDEIIPMDSLDLNYVVRVLRPKVKEINPTKCYILTDPLVKWKGNFAKYLLLKILGAHCPIYGWRDFVKSIKEKSEADESFRCVNHTLSCLESVLEDKSITDDEVIVRFPILVPDEGRKKADQIWNQLHLDEKRVYVISPGGIKSHKIWPCENYLKVIKYLISDSRNYILLTGTKKDEKIGQDIEKKCRTNQLSNLIGKTDLMELAGILQKAYMLIGNDGGTMHIGDAVGCTVVAIMPGLELPRTVEPWHNMKNSLRTNVACSPCYDFDNCPNKSFECINSIKVESVISIIESAVNNKRGHNSVRVSINRKGRVPVLRILE